MTLRERLFRVVYKLRGPLAAVPVIGAAVAFGGAEGRPLVAWALGLLLFAIGWFVRIWAQRHLGYRLHRPMALTRCGPHGHVRNPIYLGNVAMVLGAVAASGNVLLLPITFVWLMGVYHVTVHYEEERLIFWYKEPYRQYMAEVNRWVPRWSPPSPPCEHHEIQGAVLAELHTPLIMAPAVLKGLHLFSAAGLAHLRSVI